jgi:PhzF family phenazine biosynthesis protein
LSVGIIAVDRGTRCAVRSGQRPASVPSFSTGSVVAVQFELVDVFTSTHYRGNSLSVFPDAGGLRTTQMAQITGELRQFESIFLNPAGPQYHWQACIFDLFEELDFAGHPVIGAASVLHHRHGGDKVHGRWTLALASGSMTVETGRRGPGAFHAVLPDVHAHFLGEPFGISRAQVASWFSLHLGDLDTRLPLEVVSTGLRYLIVPVRKGALGWTCSPRDCIGAPVVIK